MNEEQYYSICEACDRALLSPDSTLDRVAIPWLHIIREHPVFLANYADLFEPAKGGKVIVGRCLRILRRNVGWIRQIARTLRSEGKPWFGLEELPNEVDVLFVSHLLNESQASQEKDFYFADLADDLAARGRSAIIALINHSGRPATQFVNKCNGSAVQRVILSSSLRFLEEFALRQRLKLEWRRLRKMAKKEAPGLTRRVFARASQEALSTGSLKTLRMNLQIGNLVARLQPKVIVVTHEGHAWERVAFASARAVSPSIKCVGYQHSVLFRLQHAIRRNLTRAYNPDHVLTAGELGAEQLQRAPGLKGIPVSVLGSNRGFEADHNLMHIINQQHVCSAGKRLACLVLPEGIVSECHILFDFSLACAEALPDIEFIWRLHPLCTFKSLGIHGSKLRVLPENVILSGESLDVDISRCSWALYRGTSAIIKVVGAGIRPLYLNIPGELSIDPLYELEEWHTSVTDIDDMRSVIGTDMDNPHMNEESDLLSAEQYCRKFFSSFDSKALDAVV